MRVIKKEPGKKPEVVDIENSLEEIERLIGGNVAVVPIADDVVILCNADGKEKNMPYNVNVPFFGTVMVSGVNLGDNLICNSDLVDICPDYIDGFLKDLGNGGSHE